MIRALALSLLFPFAALAQVAVNPGALDSLSAAPLPAVSAPANPPTPARRPPVRHAPPAHRPAPASKPAPTTSPAKAPAAKIPQHPVTIAPAAPPVATLTPLAPTPPVHALPPPVIPVTEDAVGAATPIPGGVRITFGPDKADLNPATAAALHQLGHAIAADPNAAINIDAYAAGTVDDPSTPRRLSLSRALAVRAVLMSEGIPSARIYPRALGSTMPGGPADRADVQKAGSAPPDTPPP